MNPKTVIFALAIVGCALATPVKFDILHGLECLACKALEPEFVKLIDKEEPVVEKDLDGICNRLLNRDFISKACVKFVNENLGKLVTALNKDGADPAKVCMDIDICKSEVVEAKAEPVRFGIECEICTLLEPVFVKLIDKEEPVVEKDLDEVCREIPVIGSACVDFVNSHIEELIKALNKDGTNPKQVCIDIDACDGAAVDKVVPARLSIGQEVECEICTLLEPVFLNLINKEEPVVEKDLDDVCREIPLVGSFCVQFVNSHIEELVNALNKDGTNPKQVCIDIHACKAAVILDAHLKPTIFEGEKCFLCHAIFPELEKLAGKEEPEIIKGLEEVCKVVEFVHLEKKCDAYIEKEGAMIAKVLAEDSHNGATELCTKIGWC